MKGENMENAEAIATVLRGVAAVLWPIVALVVILLHRKNVGGLIDRIVKAKVPGGLELEAVAKAAHAVSELQQVPDIPDEVRERLARIEEQLQAAQAIAAMTGVGGIHQYPTPR